MANKTLQGERGARTKINSVEMGGRLTAHYGRLKREGPETGLCSPRRLEVKGDKHQVVPGGEEKQCKKSVFRLQGTEAELVSNMEALQSDN